METEVKFLVCVANRDGKDDSGSDVKTFMLSDYEELSPKKSDKHRELNS